MYLVDDFYKNCKAELGLKLLVGEKNLRRVISKPEVQRPGLSLSGYTPNFIHHRILIFGKIESNYLKGMSKEVQLQRLETILSSNTPAVIVGKGWKLTPSLRKLCKNLEVPLFQSPISATKLLAKITSVLQEKCAPSVMIHGTLVDVHGMGALITGEAKVGKSEAALALIAKGHRLISDDVVKVYKKEGAHLVGYAPDLTRHLIEIRGIGIINVAHVYGAGSVRPDKSLDIVIKLEQWDDKRCYDYDRVGLTEKFCYILGEPVALLLLPVKPGRDVALLIEAIALNQRLKVEMGRHCAKEFNRELLQTIAKRQEESLHEVCQKSR